MWEGSDQLNSCFEVLKTGVLALETKYECRALSELDGETPLLKRPQTWITVLAPEFS